MTEDFANTFVFSMTSEDIDLFTVLGGNVDEQLLTQMPYGRATRVFSPLLGDRVKWDGVAPSHTVVMVLDWRATRRRCSWIIFHFYTSPS